MLRPRARQQIGRHPEVGGRCPQTSSSAWGRARRGRRGGCVDDDHEQDDDQGRQHREHRRHGGPGLDVLGELRHAGQVGRLRQVDPDLALRRVADIDRDDRRHREHESEDLSPGGAPGHVPMLPSHRCPRMGTT
jgi:hypothetical protein